MIQQYIFLYIPLIFCCTYGIYEIIKNSNIQNKRILKVSILTIYSIAFICFLYAYTTKHVTYLKGWQQALERSLGETKVVNISNITKGQFLLGTMYSPKKFTENIKVIPDDGTNFLIPKELGKYRFHYDKSFDVNEDEIYIFSYRGQKAAIDAFLSHGFSIDFIDDIAYVYKENKNSP